LEEYRDFQRRLEDLAFYGCVFCWGMGLDDTNHSGLGCARDTSRLGSEAGRKAAEINEFLRRRKVVEKFGCCMGCFVPQELCNSWQEDTERGGWQKIRSAQCQYDGIVVSVIAFVSTIIPEESEMLYEKLGFVLVADEGISQRQRNEQVWRWMGKRTEWAGVDIINMCRVFRVMASKEE
jgi:hypothetical protein